MKKYFEGILGKSPILRYILSAMVKWFIIAGGVFLLLFLFLLVTGLYSTLENMLNLKYNSPFLLFPMAVALLGSIACFILGCISYFHKYKRPILKTKFSDAFSALYDPEQKSGKR